MYILGNSHGLKVMIHSLWFYNPLLCSTASWTNRVGYIIQHGIALACSATSQTNQVGFIPRLPWFIVDNHKPHPCPWAAPSDLGVVIDDKSWLLWYNYYLFLWPLTHWADKFSAVTNHKQEWSNLVYNLLVLSEKNGNWHCQAVYIDESYSDKAQNGNDLISCLQPMAIDIPSHW